MSDRSLLVIGVGNILLGDEGVGVHAIRRLGRLRDPPPWDLLDGGTGGFDLLDEFQRHRRVIVVDAALDGQPAGQVSVRDARYASEYPRVLTAHDLGLRDLLETASLLGTVPECVLVTVSIEPRQDVRLTLSPAVEAALDEVLEKVRELAARPRLGPVRAFPGGSHA